MTDSLLSGNVSFGVRIQAYVGMLSHMPAFAASATDLSTLALLVRPLAPAKAAKLWECAKSARVVRPNEKRVLEGMDVNAAAAKLASPAGRALREMSPLGALGVLCVREDVRRLASKLFIRAAGLSAPVSTTSVRTASVTGASSGVNMSLNATDDADLRACVNIARALGGKTATLANVLEHLASENAPRGDEADVLANENGGEDILLGALARVKALFPEGKLRTAPLSINAVGCSRTELRRMLGADVFEDSILEDARDRVVDLIMEADRADRRARS
jgi:hypothetical protein